MNDSHHDIVVFGATSFVGQILVAYLYERHGVGREINWAIAGRSQAKLESVRESLGADATGIPLIVADAGDEAALRTMCGSSRVVISTVGPYALYGSVLVKVCAETGTDYVDLTGETQWIRRMIEAHEATAQQSGARIVHCCGFDSIPSDFGVYHHQKMATERFGEPSTQIRMQVARIKGGASGGTIASMMNIVKEVTANPALRKELANPYSLVANSEATARQLNVKGPERDSETGAWLGPFVMAAVNTRIVHRSNALGGYPYGTDFMYDEAMRMGRGTKGRMRATMFAGSLGAFMVGAALPPTRWVLESFIMPKPGEGPSPQEQQDGMFDLRFYGTTASGNKLVTKVTGDRDPGYGSTAKMLGEAGVCLAQDISKDALAGGLWTPSTALGDRLMARLTEHAGITFEVVE